MGDRSTAADINNIQAVVEYALSKAREIDGESEREREREREIERDLRDMLSESVGLWGLKFESEN